MSLPHSVLFEHILIQPCSLISKLAHIKHISLNIVNYVLAPHKQVIVLCYT